MGNRVTPTKFKTCICGKQCKGLSALATHGRACPAHKVRDAMFLYTLEYKFAMPSDAAIRANLVALAERLAGLGFLDEEINHQIKNSH